MFKNHARKRQPRALCDNLRYLWAHGAHGVFPEYAAAEKGFEAMKKDLQDFVERSDEINSLDDDEAFDASSDCCEWFTEKY